MSHTTRPPVVRDNTLEDRRQQMLHKRNPGQPPSVAPQSNGISPAAVSPPDPEHLRNALFRGRAVNVQRLEPHVDHPAVDAEADPHRLFQMLRRKKKGPGNTRTRVQQSSGDKPLVANHSAQPSTTTTAGTSGSSGIGQPVPPLEPTTLTKAQSATELDVSARENEWWGAPPPPPDGSRADAPNQVVRERLVNSARPVAAKRPTSRAGVHSAQAPGTPSTFDGRPATRQKHPKMALDLFDKATTGGRMEAFPPKPALGRKGSNASLNKERSPSKSESGGTSPQQSEKPSRKEGVNFGCLFFNSDDDLEGHHEEFPAPKPPVDIPLIETDWFTTDTFELLPTTDGGEQLQDPELDDNSDAPQFAQSLYEMLVAQKRRGST